MSAWQCNERIQPCKMSDAWRCARDRGRTDRIACECPCHAYIRRDALKAEQAAQFSKIFPDGWMTDRFQISCLIPRTREYEMHSVVGETKDILGIHHRTKKDDGCYWTITHLATGWAVFDCISERGAKLIAEYLLRHHRENLAKIKIVGGKVAHWQTTRDVLHGDRRFMVLIKVYSRRPDPSPSMLKALRQFGVSF